MLSRLFFLFTNNIVVNNLLIGLRLDAWMTSKFGIYKRIRINRNLSAQEMAGFSKRADVQEALDKAHQDLEEAVKNNLKKGDRILDIGSGAGAYLKTFAKNYRVVGIDLNKDMIEAGKINVPEAEFILADFLSYDFHQTFQFIYSVSVLEFIPPSKLQLFFDKVHQLLAPGGVFYLNYPPAISKRGLYYPDLYYIEYSPLKIEQTAARCELIITKHEHAFDGRKITTFDASPYFPGTRTFKNGYLLIANRSLM